MTLGSILLHSPPEKPALSPPCWAWPPADVYTPEPLHLHLSSLCCCFLCTWAQLKTAAEPPWAEPLTPAGALGAALGTQAEVATSTPTSAAWRPEDECCKLHVQKLLATLTPPPPATALPCPSCPLHSGAKPAAAKPFCAQQQGRMPRGSLHRVGGRGQEVSSEHSAAPVATWEGFLLSSASTTARKGYLGGAALAVGMCQPFAL